MGKGLFDCTGKVTMVTGGNGGIGLGFAMGVAKHGRRHRDLGAQRGKERCRQGATGSCRCGRVVTYQVDVAPEEQIIAGYAQLLAGFRPHRLRLRQLGRSRRASTRCSTCRPGKWHEFLDVALHGAFFTLREGARHMVARAEAGEPGGSLVACGSLSLFQGLPGKQNYAASKAGIAAVIRCMAVEFGKYGIRANVVAPGLIMTPMMGGEENARSTRRDVWARACRSAASAIPKILKASAPTCAATRPRS